MNGSVVVIIIKQHYFDHREISRSLTSLAPSYPRASASAALRVHRNLFCSEPLSQLQHQTRKGKSTTIPLFDTSSTQSFTFNGRKSIQLRPAQGLIVHLSELQTNVISYRDRCGSWQSSTIRRGTSSQPMSGRGAGEMVGRVSTLLPCLSRHAMLLQRLHILLLFRSNPQSKWKVFADRRRGYIQPEF